MGETRRGRVGERDEKVEFKGQGEKKVGVREVILVY